ncbi:MAG: aminopeptidase P family protein [Lachnospiraceae bacterium]|jgi:Xaa-Pro aminopeptidase|nr:aminopeptidase P family protein [Lachnospiraceae bacterium]
MNEENINAQRLAALRTEMRKAGVDFYMIPTTDFHDSEYSADYFKEREFFCGFSGTNGTLVVSAAGRDGRVQDGAGLWTDGRYWIQAEGEMAGAGVALFKMGEPGVPDVLSYLRDTMPENTTLGFDGRCVSRQDGAKLESMLAAKQIRLSTEKDLGNAVWKDRPPLPCHKIYLLTDRQAGAGFAEKIGELRAKMQQAGAKYYVSSKLDDLMWLTNMRGDDVECCPVALSYGFFSDTEQHFFVQEAELTAKVRSYCLKRGIALHPYDGFLPFLAGYDYKGSVMYDPSSVSYGICLAMQEGMKKAAGKAADGITMRLVEADSPIELMKAVKNPVEQKNIREIYKEDSAVVCRFLYWISQEADIAELTELDAAKKIDAMRAEISDFIELSFPTIAATGPNAAMMHYEPAEGACAKLKRKGMLLVDSGGTYLRGTTDVTRTTALGPVTAEMKKAYTLTAAGNLALLNAVWMQGCTGRNLDILAREPLWNIGSDYKCGTGHGIGYVLNVHEGPQNIRWRNSKGADETAIVPGMIVSDEPGVYKDGRFGIRIETILMAREKGRTSDGTFLCFDPLTFAPLDRDLLDPRYLNDTELKWLNEYHRAVYENVSALVEPAVRKWLKAQCAPIHA